MRVRFVTVAVAALAFGTMAAAEPAKTPPKPDAETKANSSVVLASADHSASPPQASDAAPVPPKHRASRVTTCRCGGDPQLEPQQDRQ